MDRTTDIEAQDFPDSRLPPAPAKGRAAAANPDPRRDALRCVHTGEGWSGGEDGAPSPRTVVLADVSKSIIVRNDSPDVPFEQSINPYRGCEHGCIYCFARPSHAFLGCSPGRLLRHALAKPGYRCSPIAFGTNTDCYQPVERRLGIMRGILEVLAECRHPLSIVTKSALIERDLDILGGMARDNLVHVIVSVTSLDAGLPRHLEPRAAQPARRIETIRRLNDPRFGERMRGSGHYADMLHQRFRAACRRLGLDRGDVALDCGRFVPPRPDTAQGELF